MYFGVGTMESYLNQEMRKHLASQGKTDEEVFKVLRGPSIKKKLAKWPEEICGKPIQFEPKVLTIIDEYKAIRDEITHPKNADHSIYLNLDAAKPDELVDAVATALVTMMEERGKPFPFWLLGWNYVGHNGNPAAPFHGNNLNGFAWSLINMGFTGVHATPDWERTQMSSLKGYRHLQGELAKYPDDIEPFRLMFPSRPFLTRRWWDEAYIKESIERLKALQTEAMRKPA
jgi:hypothetical protein